MTGMMDVYNALRTFFEPVEINCFSKGEVAFGYEWSVICEPHDHWRVRVAKRHGGPLVVNVGHPGEGETFAKDYPADCNFGEVLGAIGLAVPVKGE